MERAPPAMPRRPLAPLLAALLLPALLLPAARATVVAEPTPKPDIRLLEVRSEVLYRYARTHVFSRVANPANVSQEVVFRASLPDTAFVSGFAITVNGAVYHSRVEAREEARREYEAAVSEGRTAAHVAVANARDASVVHVALHVEARGKAAFNLTYEELLRRDRGLYRLRFMIDPGQVVKRLSVEAHVRDAANLTTVRVPRLRAPDNEVDDADDASDEPLATVTRPAPGEALVQWSPDAAEQRRLASAAGGGGGDGDAGAQERGVRGLLEVQFDVARGAGADASELVVGDGGYFVHFFAPADLPPLPKHVVFVLDVSGSMYGRKIEQVKEAMAAILSELAPADAFSLVLFSSGVRVWAPPLGAVRAPGAGQPLPPAAVVAATPQAVRDAQSLVNATAAIGATHMYDALQTALRLVALGRETDAAASDADASDTDATTPAYQQLVVRQPLVVFLTDGEPNGPHGDPATILRATTAANAGAPAPLYSLAFGAGADFAFLKRLSLRNAAFARRIYEAADAALQLRNFYRQVASPLLANVTFQYVEDEVDAATLTATTFPVHVAGSELAVAGRLQQALVSNEPPAPADAAGGAATPAVALRAAVSGRAATDDALEINAGPALRLPAEHSDFVERLWAYLTVKQLLERAEHSDDSAARERARDLATRYSFVTAVTSLVVSKPGNGSSVADVADAAAAAAAAPGGAGLPGGFSAPAPGRASLLMGASPRLASHSMAVPFLAHDAPRMTSGRAAMRPSGYARYAQSDRDASVIELPASIQKAGVETRAPRPDQQLVPLSNLTWLNSAAGNGTHVFVPGTFGLEAFAISDQENNTAHEACNVTTGGAGGGRGGGRRERHCRHLRHCALSVFAHDVAAYLPYFCPIGEFAGVCCPDNLFNASGQPRRRHHRRRISRAWR